VDQQRSQRSSERPEAIEEWEFDTRMGGDIDQVRALLRKVNAEVGARRRADPDW
jgi:hypothetical protein